MTYQTWIAASCMIVFASKAVVAEEGYVILSNGQITCGDFLSDNPSTQASDTEWVLGYISGLNKSAPVGSRNAGASFTTPASVTAWLQNYCRTHALDFLPSAAEALRAEFLRREVR